MDTTAYRKWFWGMVWGMVRILGPILALRRQGLHVLHTGSNPARAMSETFSETNQWFPGDTFTDFGALTTRTDTYCLLCADFGHHHVRSTKNKEKELTCRHAQTNTRVTLDWYCNSHMYGRLTKKQLSHLFSKILLCFMCISV